MKRFTQFFALIVALFVVSCTPPLEAVREISINASTAGFENGETNQAPWRADEFITLFSVADPTPADFTLVSGADTQTATFKGTIRVHNSYFGFRCAEASAFAVANNEISFSTIEPFVGFDLNKVAASVPQVGVCNDGENISFSPIFGAVAIPLALDSNSDISTIKVTLPAANTLCGLYSYNPATGNISVIGSENVATVQLGTPVTIGTMAKTLYIALPKGTYSNIEVTLAGGSASAYEVFTVQNVTVKEGAVTTVNNPTHTSTPLVVGDWRLAYINGKEATGVEVFLSIVKGGSFTLYQRSGSAGLVTFTGTWTYTAATKVLSGVYSDGTAWGASYYASITDEGMLKLVNTANENEVAIYQTSTLPTKSASSTRSTDVKPFL